MQFLDRTGVGTLWSICKEKFALTGHTHNYAGSGSPGGSANSAIGVVDYNGDTDDIIQIGISGPGISGDEIAYIAGYVNNPENVSARIKDVSKDALQSWLGLGSLAYSSSSIPTKLSQLNNDKGFVTGSVSGNTVTINGASTTWTNTWRGIQDNLTSTSTSDSLSANQGKVLKQLIDNKANSSDLSSYAQKYQTLKFVKFNTIKNGKQYLRTEYADGTNLLSNYMENASPNIDGCMSKEDKAKLDGIASGANNYTLPTASAGTLGGIKVSGSIDNTDNSGYWPIYVNSNGVIHTIIDGLNANDFYDGIGNIIIKNNNYSTKYTSTVIERQNLQNGIFSTISLPAGSGTLALESDIPTKTSQLTNDSGFLKQGDFECTIHIYLTDTQLSNDKLKGATITIEQQGEDVVYKIWEGSPILFTADAKAKIKISVSHVNGYITPNAVEYKTVIGMDEDITFTYIPASFGVYIYDTNNKLTLPDKWNSTNNSKAVGVYVGTENSQFIIAPTYEKDGIYNWGAKGIVYGIITSDDSVTAKKDYAGKANTDKIIAQLKIEEAPAVQYCRNYTFKNGKKGYLWSLGEACEAFNNRKAIDEAMGKIGGDSIYPGGEEFWTSTQFSSSWAWTIDFSGISDTHYWSYRDKLSARYVRAVCSI